MSYTREPNLLFFSAARVGRAQRSRASEFESEIIASHRPDSLRHFAKKSNTFQLGRNFAADFCFDLFRFVDVKLASLSHSHGA